MPKLVVNGAMLKCSMGLAPSTLTVLPQNLADGESQALATVMDQIPMTNVAPFGMCRSPANPQVAAATAAAMGVLTPQPCVPIIPAPWTPGSTSVKVSQLAALTADSKCMCQWTGQIEITFPGSTGLESD